jgi:ribosome-binding protein aMBF1 (putative translation factor)
MNRKHFGITLEEAAGKLEKKHPGLRVAVDQYKEKAEMAMLLRTLREKENLSQVELAQKAEMPQSVISRIESVNSSTLPRFDLFTRLVSSMGYRIVLGVEKVRRLRVRRHHSIKTA